MKQVQRYVEIRQTVKQNLADTVLTSALFLNMVIMFATNIRYNVPDKGSCAPEIFYRMLLPFRFLSPESRHLLYFYYRTTTNILNPWIINCLW